ncbi:MAG: M23 family metallopeptidase [Lachnospiraceae bacterium]|nr:M23 family metallopeptidase [Lachnospiraceae bacterium]
MRKRNRMRGGAGKERAIMLAASVFVLSALTLTGVYVKESNTQKNDDGYSVDLSSLEKNNNTVQEQAEAVEEENNNSLSVQNPNAEYELDLEAVLEEGELESNEFVKNTGEKKDEKNEKNTETSEDSKTQSTENDHKKENKEEDASKSEESTSVSTTTWKALEFTEEKGLVWPTVGEILINYSMDKTVYFPTLAQYKYNPAIVISAAEGKTIVAAADARITEIFTDSEIGQAVKMDLGNGYELIYGQLADIQVSKGAYVSAGDVIGTVGTPTKYYSVEGSNLYVKLSKDGEPVNPLTLLPQ